MIVVPFQAAHVEALRLQEAQNYLAGWLTPERLAVLEKTEAFTGLRPDGTVLGAAGVIPMWEGRAVAWALLACDVRAYMIPATRAISRFLEVCAYRRVEAHIDDGFEPGHRWAKLLGFERETVGVMKAFRPDGGASALYARVRA